MSYLGVPPFGQTVRTITESLATAGQTTFSPSGGYLPGYIDVFLNGSALGAADFTATNGSTVVLNVAAALNDEFKAIAYWPVSLIDTYRKAEADALLAARVGTTSSVSMRNRIINGDMRIDQRNAGASVTPTNAAYAIDRFVNNLTQASKFSVQQSTTAPAGFSNSMLVTSLSAYSITSTDNFQFEQRVEGFNFADMAWGTASASAVTLSFWVRSSLTGTFGGSLRNNSGDRSYPFTYSISAANTWEQKTVTIAGDTTGTWVGGTNGIAVRVGFSLGTGSTLSGTAGAWAGANYLSATGATSVVGTSGATFYITGVQLEAGTVATPFERRDYGRELMMCQRYFETSFGDGTAPSNGSSTSFSTENGIAIGVATNRLNAGTSTSFSVKKRAQPTITTYGNSSGYWAWVSPSGTAYTFSVHVNPNRVGTGAFGFNQQVVDGALVVCFGHWTASAEL